MEDQRSEAELIIEAIKVQDACNLSGVVNSFAKAIARLWRLAYEDQKEGGGRGTDWVNRHRVSRLYADKIKSLAGEVEFRDFDLDV
jgi:hypothetical protein